MALPRPTTCWASSHRATCGLRCWKGLEQVRVPEDGQALVAAELLHRRGMQGAAVGPAAVVAPGRHLRRVLHRQREVDRDPELALVQQHDHAAEDLRVAVARTARGERLALHQRPLARRQLEDVRADADLVVRHDGRDGRMGDVASHCCCPERAPAVPWSPEGRRVSRTGSKEILVTKRPTNERSNFTTYSTGLSLGTAPWRRDLWHVRRGRGGRPPYPVNSVPRP